MTNEEERGRNKMKTKRHEVAPIILAKLKRIPYGKAIVFKETEEFKGNSIQRFLKRRQKKGQLRDFYCVTRIIYDDQDPQEKKNLGKLIFIARRRQANYNFSYVM